MSATELERRLADVLQRHAEDAMSRTNTDEQLAELLDETRASDQGPRRWLVGGLVAAAAVAALAVVLVVRSPEQGTPEPAGPLTPEQVATEYLRAAASYDLPRAASYLSESALADWGGLEGWRSAQLWNQAVLFEMEPGTCRASAAGQPELSRVECPYAFHSLGSEQLGLGPFDGSSYQFTVRDGEIVKLADDFEFIINAYSKQVWEPFATWVADNHPQDFEVMYDEGVMVTTDESIALWHEHAFGYIAARLAAQ
jgi:hypothetical protein